MPTPTYLSRLLLLAGGLAGLVLASGCRGTGYLNSYVESHNSENRQLEDEIYELQGENEALLSEVESLKEQISRLKSGDTHPRGGGLFRNNRRPSTPENADPGTTPPVIEEGDSVAPEEIMPSASIPAEKRPTWSPTPASQPLPSKSLPSHSVRMPQAEDHEDESLPVTPRMSPATGPEEAPSEENSLPEPQTPQKSSPSEPEVIDNKVSQIYLNPQYTGSANLDNTPGDDGINVLIQPQNQSGQFVPQAGQLTIVALDPTRQGDAARLARWEFDADAIQTMLSSQGNRRGIFLQLPWPGQAPSGKQVQIFVRYRQGNATPIQTRHELALVDSRSAPERWVRRSPKNSSPAIAAPARRDSHVRQASAEQ